MKKIFSGLILLLLFFGGCTKTEIAQLDLKGTIKGEIRTYNEFGNLNSDNENVLVQLEGSDPLISTLTDSNGNYIINDIPTGTYNYIVSKEGYGEIQSQGMQIIGGDEPIYYNSYIWEKPSTTIENLSLEIVDTEIHLKGAINHKYISDEWNNSGPAIMYFIHNANTPSSNNYLQTGEFFFYEESGSQFETQVLIDSRLFPSGSKIYIIAYGRNRYGYGSGYYDILSNQHIYTNLGAGSNIASITLP